MIILLVVVSVCFSPPSHKSQVQRNKTEKKKNIRTIDNLEEYSKLNMLQDYSKSLLAYSKRAPGKACISNMVLEFQIMNGPVFVSNVNILLNFSIFITKLAQIYTNSRKIR